MPLTGPRSVAIDRLHPCSHWPLFALYPFTNTGIFEEDPYLNISKKDETFKYLGQPHTLKSNSRVFILELMKQIKMIRST